jgi:hypothetical protein
MLVIGTEGCNTIGKDSPYERRTENFDSPSKVVELY